MLLREKMAFSLIFLTLSVGCLPLSDSKPGATRNRHPSTDALSSNKDLYWKHDGREIEGMVRLNQSLDQEIYLYGKKIHEYLSHDENHQNIYCLVVSLADPLAKEQLRMRAVVSTSIDTIDNEKEYFLRLDIHRQQDNTTVCTGTVENVPDLQSAFSINQSCTTCQGIILSNKTSLYQSKAGIDNSRIVPNTALDLTGLSMSIDPKNNILTGVDGCSNNSCESSDFDCCLAGQCVKDGNLRPNAENEENYTGIIQEVEGNPLNFIKYPQIYFVCGSRPNQQESANSPVEQEDTLANEIRDYQCLEEGKKEVPDFVSTQSCGPGFDQESYETIRSTVWVRCGCNADPFPTDPLDQRCPDFGLKAIYDEKSPEIIKEIVCDTPADSFFTEHFQDLNIIISSRTAPHRFFKQSDGLSVDDVSKLKKSQRQEGDEFTYADESNKSIPQDSPFGMNALLGQMSVSLDRAYPAKVIPIRYDQSYIISAIDGLYIPCPDCAQDNWNQLFSTWPNVTDAMGLQTTGYGTNRSLSGNNITGGNYEDTIFGRACWVPPTMIPFSHKADSNLQEQRLNRLQTQAMFFINGYQRDWYGFNKGALIGSFDGVKWFAIGQGRRVVSTSKKLFLAINSPFADIAADNVFKVSVVTDVGGNVASNYDYNPEYNLNDPRQNQGATCQANHFCEKDNDCVAKLGWEYTCADVGSWRTQWPKFDLDANEMVDTQNPLNFSRLAHGGLPPGENKRCVYRGSGAICKRDYTNNLTNARQELFRCAPNFHCMSMRENEFNDKVVRTTEADTFFLYGHEANILGRPVNYIGGEASIPLAVRENVTESITLHDENSQDDWGVCRPGKRFVNIQLEQHRNKNNAGRADFISQIAPCDSNARGDGRVVTCPAFNTDESNQDYGNYVLTSSINLRKQQNSCGKAAIVDNGRGAFDNIFALVEAEPVSTLRNIADQTVVADACFRKAGAFCHSDLDCAPNRLHEGLTVFLGPESFGGTRAEFNYWEEFFICGQGDGRPNLTDPDYKDYDLTKNRCCRPLGETLTMYTEVHPTDPDPYAHIPDFIEENTSLDVSLYSIDNPSADNRYSRYSVLGDLIQGADGTNRATSYYQEPRVRKDRIPKEYQWKTINDTGVKSCCGGGFVRKFADGDQSWVKNRLYIEEEKFACLNYETELYATDLNTDFYFGAPSVFNNYENDYKFLCISPGISNNVDDIWNVAQDDRYHINGCVQVPLRLSPSFRINNPENIPATSSIMDTTPLDGISNPPPQDKHMHAPFMPTAYRLPWRAVTDTRDSYNYFYCVRNQLGTKGSCPNENQMAFYLPFYITEANLASTNPVQIRYCDDGTDNDGEQTCNVPLALTEVLTCPDPLVTNPSLNAGEYCITNDHTGRRRILYARADESLQFNGSIDWYRAGIRITYNFANTDNYIYSDNRTHPEQSGLRAGNGLYYLTKLGRLELNGVPQIFYEPLYCNSNRQKLISGIFDMENRTEFNTESFTYTNANNRDLQRLYKEDNNTVDRSLQENSTAVQQNDVVFQDKLALPQIFSGHEFRCCKKLGMITDEASKCCSNFMRQRTTNSSNGESVCVLESRTNLNVYFNRFISSEGVGEDEPGGGFIDDDFIPETGEVKLRNSSYDKLLALGQRYCERGSLSAGQGDNSDPIRRGAAFGYFEAEPNGIVPYEYYRPGVNPIDNRYFSIVDSRKDQENLGDNPAGRFQYVNGFSWNHHYYCL